MDTHDRLYGELRKGHEMDDAELQKKRYDELKAKSLPELLSWTAGWPTGSFDYNMGMVELQRRQALPVLRTAWIAVGISFAAFTLSILQTVGVL